MRCLYLETEFYAALYITFSTFSLYFFPFLKTFYTCVLWSLSKTVKRFGIVLKFIWPFIRFYPIWFPSWFNVERDFDLKFWNRIFILQMYKCIYAIQLVNILKKYIKSIKLFLFIFVALILLTFIYYGGGGKTSIKSKYLLRNEFINIMSVL